MWKSQPHYHRVCWLSSETIPLGCTSRFLCCCRRSCCWPRSRSCAGASFLRPPNRTFETIEPARHASEWLIFQHRQSLEAMKEASRDRSVKRLSPQSHQARHAVERTRTDSRGLTTSREITNNSEHDSRRDRSGIQVSSRRVHWRSNDVHSNGSHCIFSPGAPPRRMTPNGRMEIPFPFRSRS